MLSKQQVFNENNQNYFSKDQKQGIEPLVRGLLIIVLKGTHLLQKIKISFIKIQKLSFRLTFYNPKSFNYMIIKEVDAKSVLDSRKEKTISYFNKNKCWKF